MTHFYCLAKFLIICLKYDYMAYMGYMEHDVHCPKKAVKLNHSLTHCKKYKLLIFRIIQNHLNLLNQIQIQSWKVSIGSPEAIYHLQLQRKQIKIVMVSINNVEKYMDYHHTFSNHFEIYS